MHSIRRIHFPYCIRSLGKSRFALLNRQYRLVGDPDQGRSHMSDEEYQAYLEKGAVSYRGLTFRALSKITLEPIVEGGTGYFYNDSTVPTRSPAHWKAYADRLAKLAKYGER